MSVASSAAWHSRGRFAVLVGLLNLALYNVYQVIHASVPWPDFAYFYAFARAGLVYGDARMYDPAVQQRSLHALFAGAPLYPVVNPPPFAWLLAPLTLGPYSAALWIWTVAAIGAMAAAAVIVAPDDAYSRVLFTASWLAFLPAYLLFVSAPLASFVILSVALAWRLIGAKHETIAGLVLGIGLLKPTLAILVPFVLLAAGYRRAFLAWLTLAVALVAASVAVLGPGGVEAYLRITANFARESYSLRWSLVSLLGDGLPWLVAAALIAGSAVALARWLRFDRSATACAVGVAASFLINHHATPGDLMMLLLPLWLIWRSSRSVAVSSYVALAWVAAWLGLIFPIWALASAASVPLFVLARELGARRAESPAPVLGSEPARS